MTDLYTQIKKQYPPIQSLEEERRLIAIERHNEQRCRELLVLHNIGLAQTMAVQFTRICGGYEDAVQIALIGLTRAAEKFDLDKNVKFSNYAAFSILGKLSHQLVNKDNITNNILCLSMNRPIFVRESKAQDAEASTELADYIEKIIDPRYKEQTKFEYNPQKEAEKSDSLRYIERIINSRRCDTRDKEIVKGYIGITESAEFEGKVTLELLSIKYGVSKERVRQILAEYYEFIKRKLLRVPDYKLAIEGRVRKARYTESDEERYKRPTCESVRYKRIEDEGVKDVRYELPKRKKYDHHVVISGWNNFYSDYYQDIMRALTRKADIARKLNSSATYTLSLQAALQRRKAQYNPPDSVSESSTTKVSDDTNIVKATKNTLKDNENVDIIQSAEEKEEESFRMLENSIVEQDEISDQGYGIGALEDDGDLDYEIETA